MIKVEDISHVVFRAPDLDRMAAFVTDFGMIPERIGDRLYSRGRGTAPYVHVTELGDPGFVAVGFRAASRRDLELLAQRENATILDLDRPGGGVGIVLTDPDGFTVEVVTDQAPAAPLELPAVEAWNSARDRSRLRKVKRIGDGAHVVRLGHCVLAVSDFRTSERWYKERFGFITSDEIAIGPEAAMGAFMRCDRGDTPTDHHTLFLMMNPAGVGFHHAAFEVIDIDDLLLGHERLAKAGWTPEWGVGRHLLGSQVFDYWRDPWGNTLEHWTDGDLLTASDGSNVASIQDLLSVQWGPAAPGRA